MSSSTDRGYGFEYSTIHEGQNILNATIGPESQDWVNKNGLVKFGSLTSDEQKAMLRASRRIINFLKEYEPWLGNGGIEVHKVKEIVGSTDVSDVRFSNLINSVGLSLKSNHDAIKHPRVSPTIDIANQWLNIGTDAQYLNEITEIFNRFFSYAARNGIENYNELAKQDLDSYLYHPISVSVAAMLLRGFNGVQGQQAIPYFLKYLIGDRDFYKAKANFYRNEITIEAYDFTGSLGSRSRLNLPTRCLEIRIETGRTGMHNYINIVFDGGWHIRMRLHSARTRIEKSLKWDIQFVGTPHDAWTTRIRF